MSQIGIPFVELKRNYLRYKKELNEAAQRVLSSGWYVLGEELKRFEQDFAGYCGVNYGVGVASGTEAIQIALSACGVRAGDDVLTVSNTCVPTVAGIEATGAKCIFVDINPNTYTMNPELVEQRLTRKTEAIVVVHLYGHCADMDPIIEIGKRHDLKIIEDCAQAHGANYKGRRAGSLVDAAAFSFYPTKNLGALGDAGMVVTGDSNIAERVTMLRDYGQKGRYHHVIKGINSRMDELQAAILRTKLPYLDEWNERRQQIAAWYISEFEDDDIVLPVSEDGQGHVYHLFVVRVQERNSFRRELAKRGVQTAIHYPTPVHLQPGYSEYTPQGKYLPVTEAQADELVSLPIYPELTDEEVDHIIESVKVTLRRV